MKFVFLLRGLPGSGKSTLAKEIAESYEKNGVKVVTCSADDFRMVNGVYTHVDSRMPHDQCQAKFNKAVDEGVEIIIVDNTNCTLRSMRPYVEYASPKYQIIFKTIQPIDIETLMARNIHGVPRDTYDRMLRRWVPNPTVEDILGY